MAIDRRRLRRSFIEVPTMDDHKWGKIPSIPADVFMADMEDTVPPSLKLKARERILHLIRDPSFFEGREMIVRPNNLYTEWGREDIEALAEAKVSLVNYPKCRSRQEIEEVVSIFRKHGADPEIFLAVETPQVVLDLESIANVDGVKGIIFGLGDLSLETGISMFRGRGAFVEGFLYARTKSVFVGRAHGLSVIEAVFVKDLTDLEAVRHEVELSKLFGFDANMVIYPAHVPIVNELRTPTEEEVRWARRVVEAYEDGLAHGHAAVTVGKRWITIHQYQQAKDFIELAAAFGVTA